VERLVNGTIKAPAGFMQAECWFFPEHAGLKAGGRLIACPTGGIRYAAGV